MPLCRSGLTCTHRVESRGITRYRHELNATCETDTDTHGRASATCSNPTAWQTVCKHVIPTKCMLLKLLITIRIVGNRRLTCESVSQPHVCVCVCVRQGASHCEAQGTRRSRAEEPTSGRGAAAATAVVANVAATAAAPKPAPASASAVGATAAAVAAARSLAPAPCPASPCKRAVRPRP